jgi:hypothetical protein
MRNGPYILVVAPPEYPGKRYRGRYVYEHHLVWWQNTGELVTGKFLVHHKSTDKHNNAFSNLEKKTRSQHSHDHARPMAMVSFACPWCKKRRTMGRYVYRQRKNSNKSGKVFCSRSCGTQYQFNAS